MQTIACLILAHIVVCCDSLVANGVLYQKVFSPEVRTKPKQQFHHSVIELWKRGASEAEIAFLVDLAKAHLNRDYSHHNAIRDLHQDTCKVYFAHKNALFKKCVGGSLPIAWRCTCNNLLQLYAHCNHNVVFWATPNSGGLAYCDTIRKECAKFSPITALCSHRKHGVRNMHNSWKEHEDASRRAAWLHSISHNNAKQSRKTRRNQLREKLTFSVISLRNNAIDAKHLPAMFDCNLCMLVTNKHLKRTVNNAFLHCAIQTVDSLLSAIQHMQAEHCNAFVLWREHAELIYSMGCTLKPLQATHPTECNNAKLQFAHQVFTNPSKHSLVLHNPTQEQFKEHAQTKLNVCQRLPHSATAQLKHACATF